MPRDCLYVASLVPCRNLCVFWISKAGSFRDFVQAPIIQTQCHSSHLDSCLTHPGRTIPPLPFCEIEDKEYASQYFCEVNALKQQQTVRKETHLSSVREHNAHSSYAVVVQYAQIAYVCSSVCDISAKLWEAATIAWKMLGKPS